MWWYLEKAKIDLKKFITETEKFMPAKVKKFFADKGLLSDSKKANDELAETLASVTKALGGLVKSGYKLYAAYYETGDNVYLTYFASKKINKSDWEKSDYYQLGSAFADGDEESEVSLKESDEVDVAEVASLLADANPELFLARIADIASGKAEPDFEGRFD